MGERKGIGMRAVSPMMFSMHDDEQLKRTMRGESCKDIAACEASRWNVGNLEYVGDVPV
jgi:hypothetical protein